MVARGRFSATSALLMAGVRASSAPARIRVGTSVVTSISVLSGRGGTSTAAQNARYSSRAEAP
jgi:hypothetical protein